MSRLARAASRPGQAARAWLGAGIALLALAAAPVALADTTVQGPINANTHWTQAGSPYLVGDDITVGNGAVLTIDAGVTVYMVAGTSLAVQQGGVQAIGTAEQPIRILSDKTRLGQAGAPGDFSPWAFAAGTTNTRLEHVELRHGSGLVIAGASPVLNYVSIRDNAGAAISIDLAASPSGVGNEATGNGLNGIAVPPGDVVGSVKWLLRGIPYVVQTGTVSVGASPKVTQVSPAVIERGQTVTVQVVGSRLNGLALAETDRSGITITPFGGGSGNQFSLQLKAAADAALGAASLRLRVDAGELLVPNAFTVLPPMPVLTTLTPSTVLAGSGVNEIVVDGRNFNADAEVLVNAAVVPTQFVSATQLRASLPNQTAAATLPMQVRIPDPSAAGQFLSSNTLNLSVQMPVPPTLAFEPTPIAMPPDNKPHEVTLRLSKPDFREHIVSLSLSDATKASLAPATVTFAPGQTTAKVAITPATQGSVTLTATSATLAQVKVPLFITNDYKSVNTTYARVVGIVIEGDIAGTPVNTTVNNHANVGVSVGASLTGVTPRGWHRGSTRTFVVHGNGLAQGATLALAPADGVTVGAVTVAADGSSLSAEVTAAADAPAGARRVVVRDANGSLLAFADAAAGIVVLTPGEPRVDSLTPIRAQRGSLFTLEINGENLQAGQVDVLPAEGIELDSEPQINADGTQMTLRMQIRPDAALGAKVVRVTTPSGATSAQSVANNTVQVVTQLGPDYLTAARIVGVMVGDGAPPTTPVTVPITTVDLGITVGTSATDVSPRAGITGTTQTITVRGQGLQAVTGIGFTPNTGLVIGTPTVNAEGTELSFSLEVAADAPLGLRRLALNTPAGPIAFADVMDGHFLISAPLAQIDSVTPQIVKPGTTNQKILLLGRNLHNASDLRFQPATGISVLRPFTIAADGSSLEFAIDIASNAPTGTRTIVVTTPAGESTGDTLPNNSLKVASQTGATYDAIAAPLVGVVVGETTTGESIEATFIAPLVGVVVTEPAPEPVSEPRNAFTPAIGVLVGAVADDIRPQGWLQGASGTITVTGTGLQEVTSVAAAPSDGLLFEAPTVNAEGTELTVAISVAGNAPLTTRRLKLMTATGELTWTNGTYAAFGIGRIPTMDSVSPIVLEAGQQYTLQVRGHDLVSVEDAGFLGADGITVTSRPAWSQDALGELLEIAVRVDAAAVAGDRVLQLLVPGGATTTTASPANTIKVVRP